MMDYEFEYLAWKGRQLALRQKYADTPPGLGPGQAALEESCQRAALEEYQNRRKWSLTTGVQIPEEPFVGRGKELVKIRKFFEDGVRVVFLSGMGGIGKSALARTYGRVYACHYDKILLWSYDGDLEPCI